MTPNELPTSIDELQKLVLSQHQRVQSILTEKESLRREVIIAKQQAIELTSTVDAQKKRLEQSERTIKELLQALKGKKRERLDPNQLLLFDLGELEKLLEETAKEDDAQANDEASSKSSRCKKKKHVGESFPKICRRKRLCMNFPKISDCVRSMASPCQRSGAKPASNWIMRLQSSNAFSTSEPCMRMRRSMMKRR